MQSRYPASHDVAMNPLTVREIIGTPGNEAYEDPIIVPGESLKKRLKHSEWKRRGCREYWSVPGGIGM